MFITQPKGILLVLSLLVILLGLLFARTIVDIHVHDTMFVIDYLSIGLFLGGFFLFQTLIYFLTDNFRQWRSVQYSHVISIGLIMIVGISGLVYAPHFTPRTQPVPYVDHSWFGGLSSLEIVFSLLFLFFLLGQLLFIVNLIAGFLRGKKVLNPIP